MSYDKRKLLSVALALCGACACSPKSTQGSAPPAKTSPTVYLRVGEIEPGATMPLNNDKIPSVIRRAIVDVVAAEAPWMQTVIQGSVDVQLEATNMKGFTISGFVTALERRSEGLMNESFANSNSSWPLTQKTESLPFSKVVPMRILLILVAICYRQRRGALQELLKI